MHHDRIVRGHRLIDRPGAAAALLAPSHGSLDHERLAVLYLDCGFGLLETMFADGTDHVELPIRRIAREALAFGARAVVIAHNHPDGDPSPSPSDRQATRRLAEALRPLGILLADHLVLGGDGWTSFHAKGWL